MCSHSLYQHIFHVLVNGNWGSWTSWTACSITCLQWGQRSRSRACDDPAPANNGYDCSGDGYEAQVCGNASATCGGKKYFLCWNTLTYTIETCNEFQLCFDQSSWWTHFASWWWFSLYLSIVLIIYNLNRHLTLP